MRHIDDSTIDSLLTPEDAQAVLLDAFRAFGDGRAGVQERIRTSAGGVKLSTLGAVVPDQGVAGAKIYTTIAGRFDFVVLLFSSVTGRPLATFDGGTITRLRTAACSVIAARFLARPDARRLAIFGAGVQGQAHAVQLSRAFPIEEIRIVDPYVSDDVADRLAERCGLTVVRSTTEAALNDADIVVTASRSRTPLFAGDAIPEGCFVAAIGSSLPETRELDDRALARATIVAIEWRTQALRETGDLASAATVSGLDAKIVELGDLASGRAAGRSRADDLTVYKAVGIGLQDVAIAGLAYRRLFPDEALLP